MAPEMSGQKRRAESESETVHVGLNCAFCMDAFSLPPSLKTPKVLHCLHSFCLSCCHKLSGGEEAQGDPCISIQCPTCAKETKLLQGFDSLLSNFAVLKVLDRIGVKQDDMIQLLSQGDSSKQQRKQQQEGATSGRNERQRKSEIWNILANPFSSDLASQTKTARAHVRSRLNTLKECIASAQASLEVETQNGNCTDGGMALMFAIAKAEGYVQYVEGAVNQCEDRGFLAIRVQMLARIEALYQELFQEHRRLKAPPAPQPVPQRMSSPETQRKRRPRLLPPSFVQHGQSLQQLLQQGWKIHYLKPYWHATELEDLDPGMGEFLMVAARKTGEDELLLSAAGKREEILQCTAGRNGVREYNGVNWYWVEDKCFGFSQAGGVDLGDQLAEDTVDAGLDGKRLSWPLDGQVGGGRAGVTCGLRGSSAYEKIVLYTE